MLIRDGISANDRFEAKDATLRQTRHAASLAGITGGFDRRSRQEAQLRDQVRGWFADVANEFLLVPKAIQYEGVTWSKDSDASSHHTATHKKIDRPDFILGAASFSTDTGYSGSFYCGGWPLTVVGTATFLVRSSLNVSAAVRNAVFFACYSDTTSLSGPKIGNTQLPGGGLPITLP